MELINFMRYTWFYIMKISIVFRYTYILIQKLTRLLSQYQLQEMRKQLPTPIPTPLIPQRVQLQLFVVYD